MFKSCRLLKTLKNLTKLIFKNIKNMIIFLLERIFYISFILFGISYFATYQFYYDSDLAWELTTIIKDIIILLYAIEVIFLLLKEEKEDLIKGIVGILFVAMSFYETLHNFKLFLEY